ISYATIPDDGAVRHGGRRHAAGRRDDGKAGAVARRRGQRPHDDHAGVPGAGVSGDPRLAVKRHLPIHCAPRRTGSTLAPMDVQLRKWTRVEYERLVEAEILGPDDRVELLGGAMIEKEPQYSPHATGIQLVQRALTEAFGAGWVVWPQMPWRWTTSPSPSRTSPSYQDIRATTATPTRRAPCSSW